MVKRFLATLAVAASLAGVLTVGGPILAAESNNSVVEAVVDVEPAAAATYARCYKWPYQSHASGISLLEALSRAGSSVLTQYYGGTSPWSMVSYWNTGGRNYTVVMRRWSGPSGYVSASASCTT